MRKVITIAAEPRSSRGKNEARRLRVSGRIPAVLYGSAGESVAVQVNPKDLNRILYSPTGHNTIFNVELGDRENTPVMIVDWQNDPVKGSLLHADLKRIDLTERLTVKIPLHTTGDPKGVKQQGGLLELVTREIEVECLPDEIPEHFTLDVTELMLGQNLRAGSVQLTGSMALRSSPDAVICHVIALRVEEEAPAAEVVAATPAATAEPEVIKRGKKEEEGAESAEGKAKKK